MTERTGFPTRLALSFVSAGLTGKPSCSTIDTSSVTSNLRATRTPDDSTIERVQVRGQNRQKKQRGDPKHKKVSERRPQAHTNARAGLETPFSVAYFKRVSIHVSCPNKHRHCRERRRHAFWYGQTRHEKEAKWSNSSRERGQTVKQ